MFYLSHQCQMCNNFQYFWPNIEIFICLDIIPTRIGRIRQNDADTTRSRSGSRSTTPHETRSYRSNQLYNIYDSFICLVDKTYECTMYLSSLFLRFFVPILFRSLNCVVCIISYPVNDQHNITCRNAVCWMLKNYVIDSWTSLVVEWLERLKCSGFYLNILRHVESEWRQMKQCWR